VKKFSKGTVIVVRYSKGHHSKHLALGIHDGMLSKI